MTKIVYFCIRILVIKTVCFCVRILVIKTVYYWYLILSSAASLSVDTNHRTFLASPPFFLKWRWSPGYGTSCNKMTGRWCIWVVTLCFILFFTLLSDQQLLYFSCPWWTKGSHLCYAVLFSTVSSAFYIKTRKDKEKSWQHFYPPLLMASKVFFSSLYLNLCLCFSHKCLVTWMKALDWVGGELSQTAPGSALQIFYFSLLLKMWDDVVLVHIWVWCL